MVVGLTLPLDHRLPRVPWGPSGPSGPTGPWGPGSGNKPILNQCGVGMLCVGRVNI